MPQAKLTVQRGKVDLKGVVISAGSAEAQSDTLSVNIDYTNMSRQDALLMLDQVKQKLFNSPWPPL